MSPHLASTFLVPKSPIDPSTVHDSTANNSKIKTQNFILRLPWQINSAMTGSGGNQRPLRGTNCEHRPVGKSSHHMLQQAMASDSEALSPFRSQRGWLKLNINNLRVISLSGSARQVFRGISDVSDACRNGSGSASIATYLLYLLFKAPHPRLLCCC